MFTKYYEIIILPRELGLKLDCCSNWQENEKFMTDLPRGAAV